MSMKLASSTLHAQPGFRVFTSTYAAEARIGAHMDECPRISVVLGGALREESGGQEVEAMPASLVVKPADAMHRNTFGRAPVHLLTIEFLPGNNLCFGTCFSSWRWLHGVRSSRMVAGVMQGLSTATTPGEYQDVVIELLGHLGSEQVQRSQPPEWLQRVHERVQDEHSERLLTSDLAAELGVHPVYLARRYREHYGCSIREDLARLRIERCIPALLDGREELVHIALDQGFADQSHFQRKFRAAMGTTPGRFRRLWGRFR